MPTTITGVVNSVDLTQNPPLLSIGGQNFKVSQILRVIQPQGAVSAVSNGLGSVGSAVSNGVGSVGSAIGNALGRLF